MGRLPFAAGIFWKTLAVVVILVVVAWWLIVRITGYQITAADYGGTTICTFLFSYLVHLWLLPSEHLHHEDDSPSDEVGNPLAESICPSCGTRNRPPAEFCAQCGARTER